MVGIREKKKQETRQAIIAAAVKLFSENGFENTSIEDIAKTAGIGKTTIYGYFSAKDDIFLHFCDDELDQAFARLQESECEGKPLLDRLVDFFMVKFRFVTRNREFGRQMLREMIFPRHINESAQLHNQRYFTILENIFRCAREKKELSTTQDLFLLTIHFYSLYLGVLAGWYTGYLNDAAEAETGMRTLFKQAIEGVGI